MSGPAVVVHGHTLCPLPFWPMQTNLFIIGDLDSLVSILVKVGAVALPIGLMLIVFGLTYAAIVSMLRLAWVYRNSILDCVSFVLLPFLKLCDWVATL